MHKYIRKSRRKRKLQKWLDKGKRKAIVKKKIKEKD